MSFRAATKADVPFLLALRQLTMEEHLLASGTESSGALHLARVMYCFEYAQVIEQDGAPIGLLKLRRDDDAWHIIQFQLSPHMQGHGLGRRLMGRTIAEAAAANVPLRLSVLKANPARRLYERLGFAVVGEDEHELFMQREPTVA